MKIIISPSKTQDFTNKNNENSYIPTFQEKADELVRKIKTFTKDEMAKKLKLKGKILEETYEKYENHEKLETNKAILAYTGQVFKQLDMYNYSKDEYEFLQKHVYILSALYGVLSPFDEIKPYRLDMKMNVCPNKTLYSYWQKEINNIFKDEKCIINLASNEFSKMIKKDMITIEFKEEISHGKYKTIGTYSKKARGSMLDYIIKNKIENMELLKEFKEDNYSFNESMSDNNTYVFTR
ncbi:YaaA family protein [Anaeromicrobium sediminis]|uniref:UPF0246 protein CCE28_06475 n=1 Tax=Anaeromicrobium sediminis TaxID=1478221 RepID=A0A267MKH3_9FIRM|nr:YaaA family protein [Anaeromicrobium sediminis]PAB60016.1 hypothetical protein CCE28_06475 [Anaeromicrobium sediminis]